MAATSCDYALDLVLVVLRYELTDDAHLGCVPPGNRGGNAPAAFLVWWSYLVRQRC